MDDQDIAQCCAALAQPARLGILRLLAASRSGVAVHTMAKALNSRQNAVSFHLAVLARADLIVGHRVGRMVIYRIMPKRLTLLAKHLDQGFSEKST